MHSFILTAAENFCIHQIRSPHHLCEGVSKKRTLIAYIDVEADCNKKYRIYIGCEKTLLQCLCEIFLGEEISDTETLNDMLLETTNMIIGNAKVLAQDSRIHSFTLSTPHILAEDLETINHNTFTTLEMAQGEMLVALEAL